MGCKFCYQDSNPELELPEEIDIYNFVSSVSNYEMSKRDLRYYTRWDMQRNPIYGEFLKTAERFWSIQRELTPLEISIAGGEPTQTPEFWIILDQYVNENSGRIVSGLYGPDVLKVALNFTTKDLSWLDNDDALRLVAQANAHFAVSINSIRDMKAKKEKIDEAREKVKAWGLELKFATFQYVVGAHTNLDEFKEMVSKHNYDLTFLGFKETGRGLEFKQNKKIQEYINSMEFVGFLKDNHVWRLRVDTLFLMNLSPQTVERLDMLQQSYDAREGKTSAYIDISVPEPYMSETSYSFEKKMEHSQTNSWIYIWNLIRE